MVELENSDFFAHAESPSHYGRLGEATDSQHVHHATCGDWVVLDIRWSAGGRAEALQFEARGCVVSRAAASILCERAEGRSYTDLAALGPLDVLGWIDILLMPRKQQCALLAFQALRLLIERYAPADDGPARPVVGPITAG